MEGQPSRKWIFILIIAISTMVTLFPVGVLAQALLWHSDQAIASSEIIRDTHMDMSGSNVVAVWAQGDESNSRIYSNYSTDSGVHWHSNQSIDNITSSGFSPEVAISGSRVAAVWTFFNEGEMFVFSNYSADGGATWGDAQVIDGLTGNANQYQPQVAISGSNVVAVWPENDGTAWSIYSNYSTDGGATWGSYQEIENSNYPVDWYPEVAMSGLNAVAVWEQSDGSNNRIYSNYSTDGGATWSPSAQLIENNAGFDGTGPQVAMSGLNAVAVWEQSDGSNNRIYSNYSTDGGVTWHLGAQLIENNTGHNGFDPQVAMSGSNAVAVWDQSDGSNNRIYSNYSTDGGVTWHLGAQLIENNAGHDGENPQVAISGSNVVAVWEQSDGSNNRIYSNYSTNRGSGWYSAELIENNAGFSGGGTQVAISGFNAVALWWQDDNLDPSVYSNYAIITAPPTPTPTRIQGVGGEVVGVNKFGVLIPWLVPVLALMITGTIWILRRRKGN